MRLEDLERASNVVLVSLACFTIASKNKSHCLALTGIPNGALDLNFILRSCACSISSNTQHGACCNLKR